jgi:hypothetical protein
VQIGVRFEAPQHHFQKLIDISYDFKLYRKFDNEGFRYVHSVQIIMQLMLLLRKPMVIIAIMVMLKKMKPIEII